MKKSCVILLILFSSSVLGQNLQYVWNIEGTQVKAGPTKHSKNLKQLELGDSIHLAPFNRNQMTIHSSLGNYPMQDVWIMVELGDQTGFVFGGDISTHSPFISSDQGFKSIDYKMYLGHVIGDTSMIEHHVVDGKTYEVERKITFYENGKYETISFDGCFDHYYTFNGLDFNEVFFIMMSMYSTHSGNELELPAFSEEIDDEKKFWGLGLTPEIRIRETENGWEIFSYDCT